MEPNVKLIVQDKGEEKREISVWSYVMINASPYFRTLLDPTKFQEGHILKQHDALTVELLDTNAKAMEILCDIWHLKSGRVSSAQISVSTLYEIAVLVDKYDCVESIRPWPTIWFQMSHIAYAYAHVSLNMGDISKWIYICCHLGYKDEFESLTSQLVKHTTHDDISGKVSEYFSNLSSSLQGPSFP
jgi:hypothetical protein